MSTSPASQESTDIRADALANIIQLARLSRLTLLYHGAAATTGDAGRNQAAALASASAAVANGDVVMLFDAGAEFPVPDLLAAIEAAVLQAAPQAPLAPPMAGPVEALAFWQQSLGVRFLLIMQRFELALSRPDPEFDEVLLKLVHDPLDISVLLLMDETATPMLQRLKSALPELGETFLRLPETAGEAPVPPDELAPPMPAVAASTPPAASMPSAPRFGPAPFLFDDPVDEASSQAMQSWEEPADRAERAEKADSAKPTPDRPAPGQQEPGQDEQQQERSRSRRFSSLLEKAGIAPDAFNPAVETVPQPYTPELPVDAASATSTPPALVPSPAAIFPTTAPATPALEPVPLEFYPVAAPPALDTITEALPDGRAEPSFQPAPATSPVLPTAGGRVYCERRPMQVAAWMQRRRSRRRRATIGMASRVGNSSTVLFVLLAVLALLGWQMPQLGPSTAASQRGATAHAAVAQAPQGVAMSGNRYRLSINAAASSAGTGRDTR